MSPALIKDVPDNPIKVAIAFVPAVFVKLLLLLIVVPDAVKVTWPAPN